MQSVAGDHSELTIAVRSLSIGRKLARFGCLESGSRAIRYFEWDSACVWSDAVMV